MAACSLVNGQEVTDDVVNITSSNWLVDDMSLLSGSCKSNSNKINQWV